MLDLTKVSKQKLELEPEPVCPRCGLNQRNEKWGVVKFYNTLTQEYKYEAICMPCVNEMKLESEQQY